MHVFPLTMIDLGCEASYHTRFVYHTKSQRVTFIENVACAKTVHAMSINTNSHEWMQWINHLI